MAIIEYKRIIIKSGAGVPTIPASPSHDLGDWIVTDIYDNELYLDTLTGKLYTSVSGVITPVSVGPATETEAGIAEIATQAETNAGADDARIVTPLKLATWWTAIKTAASSITGVWTFVSEKIRITTSGSAFWTALSTNATTTQVWTVPDEGDQIFASKAYADSVISGLVIGTNVQAYDDALQSISGLTLPAAKIIYTTGTDTFATDVYDILAEQALSATITWTGTTAPSGTTNHRVGFNTIGKQVFFCIKLNYSVAGLLLTNVTITNVFGTSAGQLPVPRQWNGWTGANLLSQRVISAFVSTVQTYASGQVISSAIVRNAGDTDFEIKTIAFSSASHRYAEFCGSYFTA